VQDSISRSQTLNKAGPCTEKKILQKYYEIGLIAKKHDLTFNIKNLKVFASAILENII